MHLPAVRVLPKAHGLAAATRPTIEYMRSICL